MTGALCGTRPAQRPAVARRCAPRLRRRAPLGCSLVLAIVTAACGAQAGGEGVVRTSPVLGAVVRSARAGPCVDGMVRWQIEADARVASGATPLVADALSAHTRVGTSARTARIQDHGGLGGAEITPGQELTYPIRLETTLPCLTRTADLELRLSTSAGTLTATAAFLSDGTAVPGLGALGTLLAAAAIGVMALLGWVRPRARRRPRGGPVPDRVA